MHDTISDANSRLSYVDRQAMRREVAGRVRAGSLDEGRLTDAAIRSIGCTRHDLRDIEIIEIGMLVDEVLSCLR